MNEEQYDRLYRVADGVEEMSPSVFDSSVELVLRNMRDNSWPRFRESNLYKLHYLRTTNQGASVFIQTGISDDLRTSL